MEMQQGAHEDDKKKKKKKFVIVGGAIEEDGKEVRSKKKTRAVKRESAYGALELDEITALLYEDMPPVGFEWRLPWHHYWWILTASVNIPLFVLFLTNTFNPICLSCVSLGHLCVTVGVRAEILLKMVYFMTITVTRRIRIIRYPLNRLINNIGGLHNSCATATWVWLLLYIIEIMTEPEVSPPFVYVTAIILLVALVIIAAPALPWLRHRYHNIWELIHRYVGWIGVIDLLIHVIAVHFTAEKGGAAAASLWTDPAWYLSLFIFVCVFYVWFGVRRPKTVVCQVLSPGALHVYGLPGGPGWGYFARISTNCIEWHPFGVATANLNDGTFGLLISPAGDWTKRLIEDCAPDKKPPPIYFRPVRTPGFMFMIRSYVGETVMVLATGAGLAPAVPYMQHPLPYVTVHVFWIASKVQQLLGDELGNLLLAYPHLTYWDTITKGRPRNLSETLASKAKEINATAIFVVSNLPFTYRVLREMRVLGIPCYGANWDS